MARFYGRVGYASQVQTRPGVWQETVEERTYKGDLVRTTTRWDSEKEVNNSPILGHKISIVGDSKALKDYSDIRYVLLNDVKWSVTRVDVIRPRIELTLGDKYND